MQLSAYMGQAETERLSSMLDGSQGPRYELIEDLPYLLYDTFHVRLGCGFITIKENSVPLLYPRNTNSTLKKQKQQKPRCLIYEYYTHTISQHALHRICTTVLMKCKQKFILNADRNLGPCLNNSKTMCFLFHLSVTAAWRDI